MKKLLTKLLVGSVLICAVGAMASAAGAADPAIGTWTLNLEKSKFSPGPAPKSQTRTYVQTDQGVEVTFNGVAADGAPVSGKATFKYDGKDYAMTGMPNFDTLTLRRVNGSTVKSSQKRAGKIVGTTLRTISAHGKVMTLSSKGKDAKGTAFNDVMVFDKQ